MTLNLALKLALKNILKSVSFSKLFVKTNIRLRRFKIMNISKKDWELFQERLSNWQESETERSDIK